MHALYTSSISHIHAFWRRCTWYYEHRPYLHTEGCSGRASRGGRAAATCCMRSSQPDTAPTATLPTMPAQTHVQAVMHPPFHSRRPVPESSSACTTSSATMLCRKARMRLLQAAALQGTSSHIAHFKCTENADAHGTYEVSLVHAGSLPQHGFRGTRQSTPSPIQFTAPQPPCRKCG